MRLKPERSLNSIRTVAVVSVVISAALLFVGCSTPAKPAAPKSKASAELLSDCPAILEDLNQVASDSSTFMGTNIGDFDQSALITVRDDFDHFASQYQKLRGGEIEWLRDTANAANSIGLAQEAHSSIDAGIMYLYDEDSEHLRHSCG